MFSFFEQPPGPKSLHGTALKRKVTEAVLAEVASTAFLRHAPQLELGAGWHSKRQNVTSRD